MLQNLHGTRGNESNFPVELCDRDIRKFLSLLAGLYNLSRETQIGDSGLHHSHDWLPPTANEETIRTRYNGRILDIYLHLYWI
jgi:hypothetical protein